MRETAEDKVYGKIGEIKHLKRKRPQLIFGITGCMAQKEGQALIKRAPHIDFAQENTKCTFIFMNHNVGFCVKI